MRVASERTLRVMHLGWLGGINLVAVEHGEHLADAGRYQ
jgi:hypothetical protein